MPHRGRGADHVLNADTLPRPRRSRGSLESGLLVRLDPFVEMRALERERRLLAEGDEQAVVFVPRALAAAGGVEVQERRRFVPDPHRHADDARPFGEVLGGILLSGTIVRVVSSG